ncbi:MAG: hypothetical protein MRT15_04770 [archaeon YNP-LCB-003-016]|jgi:hypothetical protein|uniref:hypothetical protein n=1 Tax=Candidatus Culexarchaeum yellowstonense TaxID=2928963 RepID=UPI0026F29850|nr:hypothetical protein [Candidatus Culexarchaeum yellowstonense]MCR6691678.1 hypothetical protein [Candidatus Culexarchaeum yellowstonense]
MVEVLEVWEKMLTSMGIAFIIIGVALIMIPLIVKIIPSISIEKIPWIILWVYRKDGFTFATSPILIIIGLIYLIWIKLKWIR